MSEYTIENIEIADGPDQGRDIAILAGLNVVTLDTCLPNKKAVYQRSKRHTPDGLAVFTFLGIDGPRDGRES